MEHISGAIYGLFRGTPRHGEWVVSCLQGAWPALLGEGIAGACSPAALSKGVLTVEVRDPSWKAVLEDMSADVLKRVSSSTRGEVRRIAYVLPRESTTTASPATPSDVKPRRPAAHRSRSLRRTRTPRA